MKVLLINPLLQEDFPSTSTYPPLGLAIVASACREAGMDVNIIDLQVEKNGIDSVLGKINEFGPDIVGLTAMTPTFSGTLKTAQAIKASYKDLKVCGGGPHATLMPDDMLGRGCFNFVVRGEGEKTFVELCKALEKNGDLSAIAGLSYVVKGKVVHNRPRPHTTDMDGLPRFAYDLLPMEKYQKGAPPSFVYETPWASYCSSRSCPFGCRFCSTSRIWGTVWRGYSPERMLEDVKRLREDYSIKTLFFADDNFTFKRERIIRFCELLERNGLRMKWTCNCRVDQVDDELLKAMKTAGCWRIGFGIEAGTQKVLDWYGKKITLDSARNAMKLCKKNGISTACYFIMGAPFETEEDIVATIDFAKEIDPDVAGFSYLTPFPGTRLYEEAIENGWFLHEADMQYTINNAMDFSKFNQNRPMIKCGVSERRLAELNKRAYKEFYFRPRYAARAALNAIKNPAIGLRGLRTIMGWIR